MKPGLKPVHSSGHKNIYCPCYRACLDHAAKHHWQYWDCSECPHKQRQQPIRLYQSSHAFGSYCELPASIYRHVRETFSVE